MTLAMTGTEFRSKSDDRFKHRLECTSPPDYIQARSRPVNGWRSRPTVPTTWPPSHSDTYGVRPYVGCVNKALSFT